MTSSMLDGSIPERSTTALIGTAAKSSARTPASAPPCFPTGVRSAAQMYASVIDARPCVPRSAFRLPRSQPHPHRLQLSVIVERFPTQVPTKPRELVAPKRGRRIIEVVRIHPDRPRFDGAGHAVRLLDVLRPDPGGEAVHRAVGELDALGLVRECQHREHRAEDLFIHDLHAGLRAVEDGGLDVVALPVHL